MINLRNSYAGTQSSAASSVARVSKARHEHMILPDGNAKEAVKRGRNIPIAWSLYAPAIFAFLILFHNRPALAQEISPDSTAAARPRLPLILSDSAKKENIIILDQRRVNQTAFELSSPYMPGVGSPKFSGQISPIKRPENLQVIFDKTDDVISKRHYMEGKS